MPWLSRHGTASQRAAAADRVMPRSRVRTSIAKRALRTATPGSRPDSSAVQQALSSAAVPAEGWPDVITADTGMPAPIAPTRPRRVHAGIPSVPA